MATWKGKSPTRWSEYMGADYADMEVVWSYSTVTDTVILQYKRGDYSDWGKHHDPKEFDEHMSKEKGLAMLEQLMSWANTYEGEEVVDKILKKVRGEG